MRIVFAFFALWLFMPTAAYAAGLALDGTPVSASGASQTLATSYTTTNTNDEIIIFIRNGPSGINASTVSSVTATGLTFTKRTSGTFWTAAAGATTGDIEEWAAFAAATFSGNITVTMNSAASYTVRTFVYGISGVNPSSPFDPNASASGYAQNTTGGIGSTTVTVSTTNPNAMLVSLFTIGGANGCAGITQPSSFTIDLNPNSFSATAHRTVSAVQSSAAETWSINCSLSTAYAMLIDTVQGPGGMLMDSD